MGENIFNINHDNMVTTTDKLSLFKEAVDNHKGGPLNTSVTRLNAVKTGVFSSVRTMALSWDNVFDSVINDVYNDLQPRNEIESNIAIAIAADFYRQSTVIRYQFGKDMALANYDEKALGQKLNIDECLKISKYLSSIQNRIFKALDKLTVMKESKTT